MKMTDQEEKTEREIFSKIWAFRRDYYHAEPNDDWWTRLVNEADKLHQKYRNTFLDKLISDCVDDIERRYRNENTDP